MDFMTLTLTVLYKGCKCNGLNNVNEKSEPQQNIDLLLDTTQIFYFTCVCSISLVAQYHIRTLEDKHKKSETWCCLFLFQRKSTWNSPQTEHVLCFLFSSYGRLRRFIPPLPFAWRETLMFSWMMKKSLYRLQTTATDCRWAAGKTEERVWMNK